MWVERAVHQHANRKRLWKAQHADCSSSRMRNNEQAVQDLVSVHVDLMYMYMYMYSCYLSEFECDPFHHTNQTIRSLQSGNTHEYGFPVIDGANYTIFHKCSLFSTKGVEHCNEIWKVPAVLRCHRFASKEAWAWVRVWTLSICLSWVIYFTQNFHHFHAGYPVFSQRGTLKILEQGVNKLFHLCIFL